MESSIFFGGSIFAAVIAGAIALFAPCCISFMLPAYFASSFQNRLLLVAMTFLFAAGIATVVLPIALGASVIRQLLTTQHTVIYVTGGLLMLGLAIYVLLGGQTHLPVPGRRVSGKTGVLSVYSLGIFSGMASSCCAPVLAGVIALSSVASSFWLALGLGTAYVFGMVAPLFVIALLWEHYDWRMSRLFRPRSFTWRLGPFQRTLTGWQAQLSFSLQHYGQVITNALSWVPNWVGAVIFLVFLGLLAWYALRQVGTSSYEDEEAKGTGEVQEVAETETGIMQEEPIEY